MTKRALLFGSVAAAYEQYRLGYPEDVVDQVLGYAGRPVRTALEIGAGTGKATRVFAARGVVVTATDPDAEMLAELRTHVPDSVLTLQSSLEGLPLTTSYDLVFAAASLHWTDPAQRWQRVAALLSAGGAFASFGGQRDLADAQLEQEVQDVRSEYMADDDIHSPDGTSPDSPMQWPGTELEVSELFTDVRQVVIERPTTVSAPDYVGHLSTVSAYLQLPAPARAEAFARILAVLPAHVAIKADITLHLARKVPSSD